MANSVIEICNNALIMLGEETITALSDDSKAARLCNARWPSVRDAVLRDHTWTCVSADVSLAASTDAPVSHWDYAYVLPSEFIRVVWVSTVDGVLFKDWEIVQRQLLCDRSAPIILRYVMRTNDATQYDALLSEALSARLAVEICQALVGSSTLMQTMAKLYEDKLRSARGVNARDRAPERLMGSAWAAAKLGFEGVR